MSVFHFLDNFSLIRNKHTFKFRHLLRDAIGPQTGLTPTVFSGCFDFGHDVYNPLDTGWDFANAYLGVFRQYRESNSRLPLSGGRATCLNGFAQDTVKLGRHITMDIGMRFSYFNPWYVGKGLGAEFVQNRYDPKPGAPALSAGDKSVRSHRSEIAQNPTTERCSLRSILGAFTGALQFPWEWWLSTD
jgi:hypothetical protein